MQFLIHHFLEKSADSCPDKEAVVHGKRRLSYLEIELKSNAVANWLLRTGHRVGDRIALLMRNSPEYIFAYYGILKAGAVAVPLNTGLSRVEIADMLLDSQSVTLISEKFFSPTIEDFYTDKDCWLQQIVIDGADKLQAGVCTVTEYEQMLGLETSERPCLPLTDLDLASIIYTSGSTGKPKGVMLSHLNIVSNTKSILSYLELTSSDRCMAVLPFYYVYGKSLLNIHFAVGGTVVIDNRFTFPNAVLKTMIEEKVTGFSGVPSTFSILLNTSSFAKMEFPDLKYVTQAGGHMPSHVKEKLLEIIPDKQIFIMYGATEASARLAFLPPDELSVRMKSIGKAIPNVHMKVVLENGEDAHPEEEGELVAKGVNIMTAYWKNSIETEKVLKNGWYYTGDLGVQDKDGFFYITGRKRDMIKVGIYKVSAVEIEETLYMHPSVQEAAVVSCSDDILGEVPQAFVVLDGDATDTDLADFCRISLDDYKVPKQFVVVKSLPKNESGKILKNKLGTEWS